jgi:hypothetical protein
MSGLGGERTLSNARTDASLVHMENVEPSLRQILSKFVGARQVAMQTELYHQLGIAGDDASELLEEVHERFGTSFFGFQFDDYFPNESDAVGDHVLRLVGFRSPKKSFTLGHLLTVVSIGRWVEP